MQCADKSTNTNTTSIAGGTDNRTAGGPTNAIDANNSTNRSEHSAKQSNHRNGTIACSTRISITDVCDKGNEIEPQYSQHSASREVGPAAVHPDEADEKCGELSFSNLHLRCMCSESGTQPAEDADGGARTTIPRDKCDCCHCQHGEDGASVACAAPALQSSTQSRTLFRKSNQLMSNLNSIDTPNLGPAESAHHECSAAQAQPNDACYRQIKQSCCDDETKKNICHCATTSGDPNNPARACIVPDDKLAIDCASDSDNVSHASDATSSGANVRKCNCMNDANPKTAHNESSIQSTASTTSDSNTSVASNATKRVKASEKLVLDLNDRSKYTKEVSV